MNRVKNDKTITSWESRSRMPPLSVNILNRESENRTGRENEQRNSERLVSGRSLFHSSTVSTPLLYQPPDPPRV
ncbi:unnamed protein product [Nezara viridula]|uniref:Uncharacterized protein n=1 Tax=Nezara viridula TaxID=85310 RepID=A0A9P0MIP6_NEZVI|nr:unnamed protein product [Nezara viridula]